MATHQRNASGSVFLFVFVLGVMSGPGVLAPELPGRPQPVCWLPRLSGFDRLPCRSWVNRFPCLSRGNRGGLSRLIRFTPQPVRPVSSDRSAPDPRDRPCGWRPAAGAERAGEGVLSQSAVMPHGRPAPPNKRKKPSKIITDLSHVTQDEFEPEGSEFDLGMKIKTPKDTMLEELNLFTNKGSKMFKMRQKRVEKFIYENNPDLFGSESMENFQKLVPSLGGTMMLDASGHMVDKQSGPPVPPSKPGKDGHGHGNEHGHDHEHGHEHGNEHGRHGYQGHVRHDDVAPGEHGHGSHGVEVALDKAKKRHDYVPSYVSPWEKAMKGNQELTSSMRYHMPGPHAHLDLPKYKSFNRSATPFGGFDKASQLMTFQLPDTHEVANEEPEPAVLYQHDIGARPSFNRTPIGWVGSNEPSSIHMELDALPFDGETDDL